MVQSAPLPEGLSTEGVSPQAPAAAFGGNVIGEAAQGIGQALTKAGDVQSERALQLYHIDNAIAANNATGAAISDLDNLRVQYRQNNPGMAASDPANMAKFQSDVDGIVAKHDQGLSLAAQVQYQDFTRRYAGMTKGSNLDWADNERVRIGVQSATDTAKNAIDIWSHNFDDPNARDLAFQSVSQQAALLKTITGMSDAGVQQFIHENIGRGTMEAIDQAYSSGNIVKANQILHDHGDDMTDVQRTVVEKGLRGATLANDVAGFADKAVRDTLGGSVQGGGATNVAAAIGAEEWHGQGPAPTSPRGAVGPSQIEPATARQYGLDPSKLHDPAYAAYAKDTILAKIAALPNVQGDPARMTVAYFSGAGNVAPMGSPTPWIRNTNDGHENVATYVANVTGRLQSGGGSYAVAAQLPQAAEQARELALEKYPGNETVALAAEERVRTVLGMQIQGMKAQEDASYETLANFANAHPEIQDRETLLSSVPGGQDTYNSLPAPLKNRVDAAVSFNGREYTLDRANNFNTLKVMADNAAQGVGVKDFLAQDLYKGPYSDLTVESRKTIADAQAKNKTEKYKPDPVFNRIVHSPPAVSSWNAYVAANPSLREQGVDPSVSNILYTEFQGALMGEYTRWQAANQGKPVDDAAITSIVSAATRTINGRAAFQIPADAVPGIKAMLRSQGIANPSPYDMARVWDNYNRRVNAGGQ